MLSKGMTLTKAQMAVMWLPQYLSIVENKAFERISLISQDRPTTIICLLAKGTIDKHVNNVQQQWQGFDVQVLGVRVEGKKALSIEEELVVLSERKMEEGNIENNRKNRMLQLAQKLGCYAEDLLHTSTVGGFQGRESVITILDLVRIEHLKFLN